MNKKVLIGIIIAIIIVIGAITIPKFLNKNDNQTPNDNTNQNENKPEEKKDNSIVKDKIKICIEYFDVTNPIPVKKDNKYGYIDNEGNLIIDYQYKKAYDFNGKYAQVQDFNDNYFFIDRQNKKIMDISSTERGSNLNKNYIKYGIYEIYNYTTYKREYYDINLNKLENFDVTRYDEEDRFSDETNDYVDKMYHYGYKLENETIYLNNKELMKVDPYLSGFTNTFDIDITNYLIEQKNIFPMVLSDLDKTQIIDLISGKKIMDVQRKGMPFGEMFYSGPFLKFYVPMMFQVNYVYSFYSDNLMEVPSDLGNISEGKTYYYLEDGGTISKDSTRFVYYNYKNEKIYETSEKPVRY